MQWDDQIKGLHRIDKENNSGWYVYYRLRSGKQRRSKIGDCHIISLKQAREIAKEILAKVALGQDPFESRKRKSLLTVHDIFTQLFLDHYSQNRFIQSGTRKETLRHYTKNIEPLFGKRPIEKLSAPEIREWHAKMSKTPYEGNRAKSVLSKIFSYAETLGKTPPGSNPCRVVPNFKEKSRKRYATEIEIVKIQKALTFYEKDFPRGVAFIRVLLLSGSRPSALERARWTDLTPIGGGAILRVQGKTGVDDIILSQDAVTALEGLPHLNSDELIFGKSPRGLWAKIKKEAGCSDLRARDLRRTFGTVGLSSGISRGVISELLNHKSEQTTKIYSLLVPKAKMLAAKAIGEEIKRMAK